jgi:RTX calcium-binding nonapeptide repeat (4 copies)
MATRALLLSAALLIALPATAGAATVSVDPAADAVALSAPPFETNAVAVMAEPSIPAVNGTAGRRRFLVTDRMEPLQAGPGCEQIDAQTVACTATAVGSVRLGDGNDWFSSNVGAAYVDGESGEDVLHDVEGRLFGGSGNDVIVGAVGAGGQHSDLVVVQRGNGGPGDDVLRCVDQEASCSLDGGPGHDRLTGGIEHDRLFGRRGNDLIVSHEARIAVPEVHADRVDCGRGRRDRAIADTVDHPRGCERISRPEFVDPNPPA